MRINNLTPSSLSIYCKNLKNSNSIILTHRTIKNIYASLKTLQLSHKMSQQKFKHLRKIQLAQTKDVTRKINKNRKALRSFGSRQTTPIQEASRSMKIHAPGGGSRAYYRHVSTVSCLPLIFAGPR